MTLPAIPRAFVWTSESWGPALRCNPLHHIAPHLFTTRSLELIDEADWRHVADALGVNRVQIVTQVHGREVVVLKRGAPPLASQPHADILVSDDSNVGIAVRAADCVPLLIADSRTGAVAAVHAGWRGTAVAAASTAVEALVRESGSRPEQLVAAIGP